MSIVIKAPSGGGSVSLDTQQSVTGDHTLLLPTGVGTADQVLKNGSTPGTPEFAQPKPQPGQIIEQLEGICDGRQVTVGSGTYTLPTATYGQAINTTTYTDLTGSNISYTPPSDANTVVYDLLWHASYIATYVPLLHGKMYLDSAEVTVARSSWYVYSDGKIQMRIPFSLNNATEDIANAKVGTWNSAKTIKVQLRAYATTYTGMMHQTYYWDGAAGRNNSAPSLRITAIA